MGSSPLTRGKSDRGASVNERERLIPAHAGKIRPVRRPPGLRRAHPRSRGENRPPCQRGRGIRGSSPLTRGKCKRPIESHRVGVAHPRSRGENRSVQVSSLVFPWLIPAHAGKIPKTNIRNWARWAHPRSRGENCPQRNQELRRWGSSPLTRGKFGKGAPRDPISGLIPAHAGKIRPRIILAPGIRAHPRSRGENEAGDEKGSTFEGSSPLTRGKWRLDSQVGQNTGLIPAHAGKIFRRAGQSRYRRAHPRSRGENSEVVLKPSTAPGSSPLTRGKSSASV